ncbi:putative bifunctional diguanylate cyclase/phosphodiesterase [Noviherbaspirillum galbum]|uniref:EAL domain-containing protein n=1 Tax=Noviherbaspirillum galbum TaxID=2709383 RepID=A0A6B3SQG2_9BURK|nr:EAL domain-containing protein [Noviherbaspirillum galbum]NEX60652.1 EAL domain-containing protein [Noviherbaspirillum galbum]
MNNHSSPRAPRLDRVMTVANLASAGAALLFASVLLILLQFLSLRSAMVEDMRVQMRIIGDNSTAALMFHDRQASKETLEALSASPNVSAAGIFTLSGAPLASFARDGAEPVAMPAAWLIQDGYRFGWRELELAHRIIGNDGPIGVVAVRASLAQLHARLLGHAGLTLSIALSAMALAYLVVSRMRRVVKTAEAHLDYLAHIDPVTGLPNRHAFNGRLETALRSIDLNGGSVGLLLLDLDNFKIVNDTLGHQTGDDLLKAAARRLMEILRSGDVICRIGGDEFAIIIDAMHAAHGDAVAEKLLNALATPFEIDGHEIYVSGSIGISTYPEDGADMAALTRNADTAMYQAKGKGKNTFERFHPDLNQRAQKRMTLETNLRKALDRGELTLHYQPQVSLRDGRLVGLEALLRWRHPELGLVSPAEFIPVAEESGLIVPIGRWVVHTACRQVAAWRDAGLGDVHVCVNLSPRQARDPHMLHDTVMALREAGMRPQQLELEITETVLMENVHANVELLHRLQREGIRLSIDDFGTGYSSMAYLKRFPIDQVKIDRTFVRDIPGDGDDEAITTAIIAMAHSLGLTVVAEGVETEAQLRFLREAGCDTMQGYYFAEPRPADAIAVLLRERLAERE